MKLALLSGVAAAVFSFNVSAALPADLEKMLSADPSLKESLERIQKENREGMRDSLRQSNKESGRRSDVRIQIYDALGCDTSSLLREGRSLLKMSFETTSGGAVSHRLTLACGVDSHDPTAWEREGTVDCSTGAVAVRKPVGVSPPTSLLARKAREELCAR